MTNNIIQSVTAVVRTRLETADGGAKAALESVLRIAAEASLSDFVAALSLAVDKAVGLCFEPATFADWDFVRAMASELDAVLHLATQESEQAVHEEWEGLWGWIDDGLLEAVAALRSGDPAPLAERLNYEIFTAAIDDQSLLDEAGVTDVGLLREECSARVAEIVEEVRLSLTESTDGMAANEIADGWVVAGADAAVEAAGTRTVAKAA